MLSVDEALQLVLKECVALPPRSVPIVDALGLKLAEDIVSDIDSPPFDKSLVDGYAVRSADFIDSREPARELVLLEEVVAGVVPTKRVEPGTTTRIMTGAPIPDGADAVVMIEKSELITAQGRDVVKLDGLLIRPGQNILPKSASIRQGHVVLSVGTCLNPVDIGLLAEVGRPSVKVTPRPSVAILSTGNELITIDATPASGQIRNSNESLLASLVVQAGAIAKPLGIARDDRRELHDKIIAGLSENVLLLSGGVSAGVLDLVPSVLAELSVRQVFHKVNLKPGKPLWFGVFERGSHRTFVFGLPGNPVSGLVCFRLFVRPAISTLRGWPAYAARHAATKMQLQCEFKQRSDRETFHPAKYDGTEDGRFFVVPLKFQGSADLCGLSDATALIRLPPGTADYKAGDMVDCIDL